MTTNRARLNLCGQVVHELGRRILGGEVKPGDALPQEGALCEELGVSRTVVREAIKSLAAKGLLESRPKLGTIVRPEKAWNFLDREVLEWQTSNDADGRHLFYLTELRRVIEPAAAAMAAERAPDHDLRRIEAACEEMAATADDVDAFLRADLRFHTQILHATGNPLFAPVANVIGASLESSLRVTNRQPADNRASVPLHQKVVKAICSGNPERARRAMESLLDDATARIQRAVTADDEGEADATT